MTSKPGFWLGMCLVFVLAAFAVIVAAAGSDGLNSRMVVLAVLFGIVAGVCYVVHLCVPGTTRSPPDRADSDPSAARRLGRALGKATGLRRGE